MTGAQQGPRRHQARAERILDEASAIPVMLRQALADWGAWRATLAAWANGAGFPSGAGSGPGGVGGHSDPTARAALAEDRMCAELAAADRDLEQLASAVRHSLSLADSLARRRAWVVNPAKPEEKPHLIFCENARCQERVREEAGERAREGLCPRCSRWLSRYGREYPMKEVVEREAG